SLIRLSLLHTSHARTFQRSRLRAFCPFYGTFTLLMCRSLGFGSYAHDFWGFIPDAILRLAFATAPRLERLALPYTYTRRSIMQKVRRHTFSDDKSSEHSAPTACKCMVSGTFDSANSCAFHRSIALLVHYRSSRSI